MTKPPPLPKHSPPGLEEFVACRAEHLELNGGKASWLPSPPGVGGFLPPRVTIKPTGRPNEADLTVGWSLVKLGLRASVVDGELRVEPKGAAAALLDDVVDNVRAWVTHLNTWLAANGWRLGDAEITNGRFRIGKVRRDASAPPGPAR